MRLIQNTSMQGHNVSVNTLDGPLEIFIRPKSSVWIPDGQTSVILENLISRRILRVIDKKDPPTPVPTPAKVRIPTKVIKKRS